MTIMVILQILLPLDLPCGFARSHRFQSNAIKVAGARPRKHTAFVVMAELGPDEVKSVTQLNISNDEQIKYRQIRRHDGAGVGPRESRSSRSNRAHHSAVPKHHRAHLTAAKIRHAQGLYGQAKKHAERARASLPSDLEATLLLAMISASLGRSKEAIELNRKVLHQQPTTSKRWSLWLPYWSGTGKLEQALKPFNKPTSPKKNPLQE